MFNIESLISYRKMKRSSYSRDFQSDLVLHSMKLIAFLNSFEIVISAFPLNVVTKMDRR